MFDLFQGLPVHALVVHATVVVLPTTAVAVALAALWRRFRAWAGPLPLVLALIGVVLDPISTQSGEALERRVGHNPLVERHAQLADGLLPWVLALAVMAAVLAFVWYRERFQPERAAMSGLLVGGVAILAVTAAVGTTVQVARVGHAGAKAAWSNVVQQSSSAAAGS